MPISLHPIQLILPHGLAVNDHRAQILLTPRLLKYRLIAADHLLDRFIPVGVYIDLPAVFTQVRMISIT